MGNGDPSGAVDVSDGSWPALSKLGCAFLCPSLAQGKSAGGMLRDSTDGGGTVAALLVAARTRFWTPSKATGTNRSRNSHSSPFHGFFSQSTSKSFSVPCVDGSCALISPQACSCSMCSWWVFQLILEELFYPTLLNFRGPQIQLKIEFSGQALEPNCKLKFQCKTQQP